MTGHRKEADSDFFLIGSRCAPGIEEMEIEPCMNKSDQQEPGDGDQDQSFSKRHLAAELLRLVPARQRFFRRDRICYGFLLPD